MYTSKTDSYGALLEHVTFPLSILRHRPSFLGHCSMYSTAAYSRRVLYWHASNILLYAWNGEELYTLLASYKIAVQKLQC